MIFTNLEQDGRTTAHLFHGWTELHAATFSPDVTPRDIIPLKIGGRTYKERQGNLRDLAIDIQLANDGGISWGECVDMYSFFEEQGRRYGLLREFRENGVL